MTEQLKTVKLRILGEDFTIACEPENRELLKSAGMLLDEQVESVRQEDPMLATSSVWMLAALKIATNLLQSQRGSNSSARETINSVRSVRRRVERRLEKSAGDDAAAAALAAEEGAPAQAAG